MESLHAATLLLAIASSLVLGAMAVIRSPRERVAWTAAIGLLAFALETFAAGMLVAQTRGPAEIDVWLRALHLLGFVVPGAWLSFLLATARREAPRADHPITLPWLLGAGIVLAAAAIVLMPPFQTAQLGQPFNAARLSRAGHYGLAIQLVVTVGVLGGLEAQLRGSRRSTRWRLKYLMLGLGGIFLVRFYFLTRTLLFNELEAVSVVTQAGTLFVGNIAIAASLTRGALVGADVGVSRHLLFRSIVVGALGTYLLAVGILGWLLDRLGVANDIFWASLVIFVSALGLAVLLLSEDLRWRIYRFLGRHIYESKYDYREQWSSFTKRLGSRLALDELAPEILSAVTEAVGTTKGCLYLAGRSDRRYHLASALGFAHAPSILDAESTPVRSVAESSAARVVRNGGGLPWEGLHGPEDWSSFADVAVVVPLVWQGKLAGLMLIGPERTGAQYAAEDLQFLTTAAEQAAGAIVTTRLSDDLARSRAFDTFHRLTSFVAHDLKNTVSALSMLSRNALDHFDDPEFQRDALLTLSKTVDRMTGLLGRLASGQAPDDDAMIELDLGSLVLATADSVLPRTRVALVPLLRPVPPVLGNPAKLERVIMNLLMNAVEAMGGEGQITVRVQAVDDQVSCAIEDTGCGMSVEFLQEFLFVPFQSRKPGGWGIGLYQASEIVAAHRGRIEVESEPDKGTTFTLFFPAVAPAHAGVLR